MPGPCPLALALAAVPAKRWATRAELMQRLDITRQMLQNHPEAPLNLDGLSAIAGLSKYHYVRLFGSTYGITPGQFRLRRRMEYGKSLLESGLRVSEVTLLCGFSSVPTFARQFKRQFGVPPGQIRNCG